MENMYLHENVLSETIVPLGLDAKSILAKNSVFFLDSESIPGYK